MQIVTRLRAARLIAILTLLVLPALLAAQDAQPRQGLMWNRTGLPAVFPLQVKTLVGRDYVLLLSDPETDADVLAAYIVGGKFFRVLVPPGTFRVRFASGIRWQGEDAMFGRLGETEILEMAEPLTFEVIGLRTKAGHLIDLTDAGPGQMTQLTPVPTYICQTLDLAPGFWPPLATGVPDPTVDKGVEELQRKARLGRIWRVRNRLC